MHEKVQDMKPVLLIGTNNGGLAVPLKTIQNKIDGLQICKSRLGWTIHGPIHQKSNSENFTMAIHMCFEDNEDKKVSDLLLRSFSYILLPEYENLEVIRILGFVLNIKTDKFEFDLKFKKFNEELVSGQKIPSKREFLTFMMSIFDPLGFLNPFIVKLRIIFQEVWREGTKWDDQISEATFKLWHDSHKDAASIDKVEISRYVPIKYNSIQLHTFVDANDNAYMQLLFIYESRKENKFMFFWFSLRHE